MESDTIAIKSRGKHGFFQVDNFIFNPRYDLSGYAILIYCLLCKIATRDSDEVQTTRAYLAKCARISKGSVSNATSELSAAGIISITERRNGRTRLPSLYILNSPLRRSTSDLHEELGGSTYDGQPMTVIETSVIHTLENADPKTKQTQSFADFSLTGETDGGEGKPSKEKKEKTIDPRHHECVKLLTQYWEAANPDLQERMPFDGRTAKELSKFLQLNRDLTDDGFAECLTNRLNSEAVNFSEAPHQWIGRLMDYRKGTLNQYRKPLQPKK